MAGKRENRYGRPANVRGPSKLPAAQAVVPRVERVCEHRIVGPCPWCGTRAVHVEGNAK